MVETPEEKSKLERLYREYRGLMYTAAYRILQDSYLAEDALHQAFLRLLRQLDKADEAQPARTKAFLATLAQCAALDIYRKRKRERQIPVGEWENVVLGHGEIFPDEGGDLALFAKLPADYAVVLRLRYAQDYSYEQIAQLLGISEENTRKRASRGRKYLKELLKEDGRYVRKE